MKSSRLPSIFAERVNQGQGLDGESSRRLGRHLDVPGSKSDYSRTVQREVAVIGCGTGGPAAAALLALQGSNVTLFERAATLAPIGAGFLLQPTGLEVLAELGVLEEIVFYGETVDRLYARTRGGRVLLDLDYRELSPSLRGVGIHRAAILNALVERCHQVGVAVTLGTEVTEVESGPIKSFVRTESQRHGPFDLVVIADGARSRFREQLQMRYRAPTYPWGALWFMAPDPQNQFNGVLHQVVDGCRKMVGILPTGKTLEQVPVVSLFWSVEIAAAKNLLAGSVEAWKDEVRALQPEAAPILDHIDSLDRLTLAEYRDVIMPRWTRDTVVFIGDAAHATSPQLGQGANLALVDAQVLSRCVAEYESVAEALHHFEKRRRGQVRHYQRMSRWLTPFFQSSSVVGGWLRDAVFPLAMAIGPVRRRGISLMAGFDRSLLGGA